MHKSLPQAIGEFLRFQEEWSQGNVQHFWDPDQLFQKELFPREVLFIIVQTEMFHAYTRGFHQCAGERKICKTDHMSYMCRITWAMGRE